MRKHNLTGFVLICCAAPTLAACAQFDPFQRPGTWHETHAATHDIAGELVYPQDLRRGQDQPVLTGALAQTAITAAMIPPPGSGTAGSVAGGSSGTSSADSSTSMAGGNLGGSDLNSGGMGSTGQ